MKRAAVQQNNKRGLVPPFWIGGNNMSYYNYDKIRSYNALMKIIMTNRGFGNTYGFKDMANKNTL